jgi:lipoprotein-anchoring transpeptidase ErfK/SrfK
MITKMICNYQVIEEATKLKGKGVNLTIEGTAKVFKLPSTKTVAWGKEGYNTVIAKYFVREEAEYYTPCSNFVICKANGLLKVMRHETLTKTFTIRQGIKYALGALVAII